MVDDDPGVFTLQRRTVFRAGIVVAVLAALGIGFAIGYAVHSPTTTPAQSVKHTIKTTTTTQVHNAITPGRLGTTTTAAPTTTTAQLPGGAVASCAGGNNTPARPTTIFIGCATGNTTVTAITWSSWGVSSAQGTGTFNENNCQPNCAAGTFTTVPASVVVSNPVNGFFQTVTITPTSGDLSPVSSDQPGSGWGSG